jgi:hypothetical protein
LGKLVRTRDWIGAAVVVAAAAAMWEYRQTFIEPRAWGIACAASSPPLACLPRAGLLWLQREYLWGTIALGLGLWAFLARAPFGVAIAAMGIGIAGVENYNATWGMVGAALGAWAWLSSTRAGTTPRKKKGRILLF